MSHDLDRRAFLRALGVGTAQLATGTLLGATLARTAEASHHCGTAWGAIPPVGGAGGWTCDNHPGYKILEIYQYAGASQWETFWLPGSGAPNFSDYGMGSLPLASLSWADSVASFPCEAPDIPPGPTDAQLFATQSGGGEIYWGAPARPLYRRSDILSRSRMITQYHGFAPHEAAIPFVLSGLRLGNPRRAGTGAAVQRRAFVVDPARTLPASWILHRSAFFPAESAAVSGMHPGLARPVVVQVRNDNRFVESLARGGISSESDELLLALRHEYRDRLRFSGSGDPVRSQEFGGYWVAAELLAGAPAMQALFPGTALQIDSNVAVCATHPQASAGSRPGTKTMIQVAGSLLAGPARYVCVIDDGLAGTYDTHGDGTQLHLLNTTANHYNVLHHLAAAIHHPTDNPTGTVNLDDTLVMINTEFNRTPNINGNQGRDHHWTGYVTILIGGPLTGGPSIRGAIDASADTVATHRYSAADLRGALLLAAAIDPFAPDNFRFSDFSEAITSGIATEEAVRERLRGWILGL